MEVDVYIQYGIITGFMFESFSSDFTFQSYMCKVLVSGPTQKVSQQPKFVLCYEKKACTISVISNSGKISAKRPNQIKFLPLGCRFEVRIIIAKVRGVSICNISVIFALSDSDAMLVCWQGVSACRYGISGPEQGLCLCQKGSAEMS